MFPFVDPSVSDPASRKRLTINLRLFAERFGLLLDDLLHPGADRELLRAYFTYHPKPERVA